MTSTTQLTGSVRAANKLEREDLIDWYRQELARVRNLARLDNPEVRNTYAWVTEFLEAVIAGREPPVEPPKLPPTRSSMRFLDSLEGLEPPKKQNRTTLTLGGAQ